MKIYTCPLCCNTGFSNLKELKNHLMKATNSLNCPACLKPCKNILNLINHLDQCSVSNEDIKTEESLPHDYKENDLSANPLLSDNDDDDEEGYFCTVCDIKIPDVYKHIRQFHNGQEVILQDDDDDSESATLSNAQVNLFTDSHSTKRKREEVFNGVNINNKRFKKKNSKEEEEGGETFYCPKCNVSFQSLTEHTRNFHENEDVLVQDLSITDLFPESKVTNGTCSFRCSCCQKNIVRKSTLSKHLKLNVCKNKIKNKKNNQTKKKNLTENCELDNLDSDCKSKEDEVDGEKLDPGTVYEIEEVKPESYEFDDINHSIFNT